MRHRIPKPKPRAGTEYRVRFKSQGRMTAQLLGEVLTARPGIIKNNRPRADRVLTVFSKKYEAWLESRPLDSDQEWKKI